MQTIFYKTSHFIRHTGNLVDLEEFRHRTFAAQRDSLARQPEVLCEAREPDAAEEEHVFRPVVLTLSQGERRRARQVRRAWTLDACASLAVVIMTLVFTLRVLL